MRNTGKCSYIKEFPDPPRRNELITHEVEGVEECWALQGLISSKLGLSKKKKNTRLQILGYCNLPGLTLP